MVIVHNEQEKIFFVPEILPQDYKFSFQERFEEMYFEVEPGIKLHGLLFFHSDTPSKRLIFYLHGNTSSNKLWGTFAGGLIANKHDLFILDYRGFGKSRGKIQGETQIHNDVQIVYDKMKELYDEKYITVISYSIGTGIAAKLVSHKNNNPRQLILKAPYYSFESLIKNYCPVIPSFIMRYKFMTNEFIQQIMDKKHEYTIPITIFHGDKDEVIGIEHAKRLHKEYPDIKLFVLENTKHRTIGDNKNYHTNLAELLL